MTDIRNELLPKGRSLYSPREFIRSSLLFLIVFVLVAGLNLLLHEFGHCLTMNAVGSECEGVYVYSGIQIFPLNEFGEEFGEGWPQEALGAAVPARSAPSQWADGLISLMGSGSVAILSFLALLGLFLFRPRGGRRRLFLAQSLMFLDLLTYTILPHWFGLPHFFVIGGTRPEPLNGAIEMGISEFEFIAGVLVFSLVMTLGLVRYVRQNR
jgi:hypothetical protein